MLEELVQKYQKLANENEQTKKSMSKVIQEKEQSIESIKRQYERQKQKELECLRENITKVIPNFCRRNFSKLNPYMLKA